jgi:hypothetical protein
MASSASVPTADSGGSGPLSPQPLDAGSFPSGSFWLEIVSVSNGMANLICHGTQPDVAYDIQSKENLTDPGWNLEQTVYGAPDQDWTPATVVMGERTNSLYFRGLSWADNTGSGIPDWWLQLYFGTNWANIDPFSMPAGDGWTLLQIYQNGWSPLVAHTPPAPTGLTVRYYGPGTNLLISWDPSPGPVQSYTVARELPEPAGTNYYEFTGATSFQDLLPAGYPENGAPIYRVMASYPAGPSAWSAGVSIYSPELHLDS